MTKANRAPTVATRLTLLIQLFVDWNKTGMPTDIPKAMLASLVQVAEWQNDKLGVVPIMSPNDRSSKHPTHGALIRELDRLRMLLRAKYEVAAKPASATQRARRSEDENARLKHLLSRLASQWNNARSQAQDGERALAYQVGLNSDLAESNATLRAEKAALLRTIANSDATLRLKSK